MRMVSTEKQFGLLTARLKEQSELQLTPIPKMLLDNQSRVLTSKKKPEYPNRDWCSKTPGQEKSYF